MEPIRYFEAILRSVFLEGTSSGAMVHQLWPMAVIGAVSLLVAGWMFRRRMY